MMNGITRRDLLKAGSAAAVSGLLLPRYLQGGPTLATRSVSTAAAGTTEPVLLGLYSPEVAADPEAAVRDVCKRLDWSWLSRGDTVLLKLSSNSYHPHPAATSPHAVKAVVRELMERGAGKVYVGDQGGSEYTRIAPGERRYGSTRELTRQNGLLQTIEGCGASPYFFEEHGYEAGYFQTELPFESAGWREPPFITSIVRQVDHILYLPRLSSHVLAGYTHGHKIAVGWMREDGRFDMHFRAGSFHEKYTEVNYCRDIRERFRGVITLAEQVLLSVGPVRGTLSTPNGWIVIASSNLANHDAVSVAALAYVDATTPPGGLHIIPPPYGVLCNFSNWMFVSRIVPGRSKMPWGQPDAFKYQPLRFHDYQKGIRQDLALSRAYQILGGVPASIPVELVGQKASARLVNFLRGHNGGLFDVREV